MSNLLEISLPFYPPPSHVAQPLLNFPSPIPTCYNTPATEFPKALQIFELREGWGEKCRFLQRSKWTNSTALLLKRITDKPPSRIEPIIKGSGEIYSFRHHQTVVRPVCDTKGKLWGCPHYFSIKQTPAFLSLVPKTDMGECRCPHIIHLWLFLKTDIVNHFPHTLP